MEMFTVEGTLCRRRNLICMITLTRTSSPYSKLFPHQKFLHPSWKIYSEKDKTSLGYKCKEEIDVPINEDGEFYWANKIVPMINKKYCKIRANINSGIKLEYFGKFSYLNLLS